jgi:hypothetical protein
MSSKKLLNAKLKLSMEDVKMTEEVTTSRRLYRVTYYPTKWYSKPKLVIRRLGVQGHDELICRIKGSPDSLVSAYSSNTRLLDIICENDPFFQRRFMLVNLDAWTDPKNPVVVADIERGKLSKKLK